MLYLSASQTEEAFPPDIRQQKALLPALQAPYFQWGNHDGMVFCAEVSTTYEEVIHWRRNLFLVPSGSTGKAFVELAQLFQAFADCSTLECIAMKVITILQTLLFLQKPSHTSKTKDHVKHLQKSLEVWHKGDI